MAWSEQQEAAIRAVQAWTKTLSGPQVFYLAGYAGTGKSTIARELAQGVRGKVLYGAFTGKAALVMQTKGCAGAATLHSMIYRLEDESRGSPRFVLNPDAPLKDAALLVVDEVSMVDEQIGRDLLSFGVKILVIGDPAQLPPVKGEGFFTARAPDVMLTEVHRQAADNPIIRMSMDVREGRRLALGQYGDSRVVHRSEIDAAAVTAADQVLVGKNVTRHLYNRRIRELLGHEGGTPLVGERLVCLRNRREKGLLNGGIWTVVEVLAGTPATVSLRIQSEDSGPARKPVKVSIHRAFFEGQENEVPWEERRGLAEMTFGYALTVHKSQGSQWNRVVVFDESAAFRDNRREWLYTAITRAAEAVTIVQ